MSESTEAVLSDIRRWVKIIGIQQAKEVMRDALTGGSPDETEQLRIIYHLTNGENSIRKIARHVSLSKSAISNRQQTWASMGLVEREHSNASYRRLISLEEAGLEKPEIPDAEGSDDDE